MNGHTLDNLIMVCHPLSGLHSDRFDPLQTLLTHMRRTSEYANRCACLGMNEYKLLAVVLHLFIKYAYEWRRLLNSIIIINHIINLVAYDLTATQYTFMVSKAIYLNIGLISAAEYWGNIMQACSRAHKTFNFCFVVCHIGRHSHHQPCSSVYTQYYYY